MKVVSLFAGIGGFDLAFERIGFEVVACVEIDKNCQKLLADKFPKAIIHDDVTTFRKEVLQGRDCDVVVGGSPCQSFSVAGLRKGLSDPRGNLTLEYLRVVSELRPSFFVWENVPGVLSDKTGAINSLLAGFEELGYLYDIDILDSQWNGVAQRRRRVFVCGVNVDFLLKNTTSLSVLIMAKCLLEILQNMLALRSQVSEDGLADSEKRNHLKDGIKRRMILLEGRGGKSAQLKKWRNILVGEFQKFLNEQKLSAVALGENQSIYTGEDQQKDIPITETPYMSTELSWKEALDESLDLVKSYTTLMETNLITNEKIYSCSKTVLLIAELIAHSNPSSPPFFSAASSALTTLQDYMCYARQTSEDLFGDMERAGYWADFIKQAEHTSEFIRNTRIECFGEVLSIAEGLRGHSPPSREKGQGVARCFNAGATGGSFTEVATTLDTRSENGPRRNQTTTGVLVPDIVGSLDLECGGGKLTHQSCKQGHVITVKTANTKAQGSNVNTKGVSYTLDSAPNQAVLAFDMAHADDPARDTGDKTNTLQARMGTGGNQVPCVCLNDQGGSVMNISHDVTGTLRQQSKGHEPSIPTRYGVRRLTPVEYERLQGFPDGWTEGFADSVRYKMLGNAVTVNVAEWLAKRLMTYIKG